MIHQCQICDKEYDCNLNDNECDTSYHFGRCNKCDIEYWQNIEKQIDEIAGEIIDINDYPEKLVV